MSLIDVGYACCFNESKTEDPHSGDNIFYYDNMNINTGSYNGLPHNILRNLLNSSLIVCHVFQLMIY
uniref:Uncharacterized protein n=1 Tax=Strongyloides venezuelensis TaxID=75913 RepID=A0A0K0F1A6_STRVS